MIWLLPWDEEATVRHLPWATWLLVAANVVVFGMMLAAPDVEAWFPRYGLTPATPHWWQ